jgi:hypothetical protein
MPKVNRGHHELGQLVPCLRTTGSDHREQARKLKAKEEAMENSNAAFPSCSAQQPIGREPPDKIQQQQAEDDDEDDRHAGGTLLPAAHTFQRRHHEHDVFCRAFL